MQHLNNKHTTQTCTLAYPPVDSKYIYCRTPAGFSPSYVNASLTRWEIFDHSFWKELFFNRIQQELLHVKNLCRKNSSHTLFYVKMQEVPNESILSPSKDKELLINTLVFRWQVLIWFALWLVGCLVLETHLNSTFTHLLWRSAWMQKVTKTWVEKLHDDWMVVR